MGVADGVVNLVAARQEPTMPLPNSLLASLVAVEATP